MQNTQRGRVVFGWAAEGGSPLIHRRLSAYTRLGYSVTYAGCDRLRNSKDRTEGGVEYRYITRGFGYANWKLIIGIPWWILKLFLFGLRARADVFHAFDLDSGFPLAAAACLRKIPLIYDVLDNFDLRHHWPWPLMTLIRAAERFTCRTAGVIAVTDQNRVLGTLAGFADKVVVINGCPPDRRVPPGVAEAGIQQGLTVALVGFLAYQRGLGLLLEAARALPQVRFVLIGRLAEAAAAPVMAALPNVTHLGALDWEQCIVELSRTDIVCAFYNPAIPINRLAASQKWYDAMMLGIPILSNREIVNAAWIEREDIGYTAPYDAAAVTALIEQISRDPVGRRRKGANGRRLYETELNWNAMEDRLCSRIGAAIDAARRARDVEANR